ncbi:MAG: hypothetical protein AAF628_16750 [Planctomycetota bacterium]
MRWWVLGGLAAVLVVAATFGVLSRSWPKASPPLPGARDAPNVDAETAARLPADPGTAGPADAAAPRRVTRAVPATWPAMARVRVVDATREPVAAAEVAHLDLSVAAQATSPAALWRQLEGCVSAWSRGDGTVELPREAAGLLVVARARDAAGQPLFGVCRVGADARVAVTELSLQRDCSLAVRVLDRVGRASIGTPLELHAGDVVRRRGRTDRDGVWRLEHVQTLPGGAADHLVRAAIPGAEPSARQIGGASELVVRLPPTGVLTLRGDVPLRGSVQCHVDPRGAAWSLHTPPVTVRFHLDEAGATAVVCVAAGVALLVTVHERDRASRAIVLPSLRAGERREARLTPAR